MTNNNNTYNNLEHIRQHSHHEEEDSHPTQAPRNTVLWTEAVLSHYITCTEIDQTCFTIKTYLQ